MKGSFISGTRLHVQQLSQHTLPTAPAVVQYMGVIQSQDYAAAKWGIGIRMPGLKDALLDQALYDGSIIRTHVLRPTWHFVAPADVRWMLRLSAPRINQACAYNFRRMQLDTKIFNKCNGILEKALAGGHRLERTEIAQLFSDNGVATDDLRLVHLLIRAEIDGVICSGGRQGKQFTYALLNEQVPATADLHPADPLAELARRYFVSHGPATIQDYTWWSGLTATDAKKGLEMVKNELVSETIDGSIYWMGANSTATEFNASTVLAHLLPSFDEYMVAYKDRSAILAPHHAVTTGNGIFYPVVALNGIIAGTWQRQLKKGKAEITLNMFDNVSKKEQTAIDKAIAQYRQFVEVE